MKCIYVMPVGFINTYYFRIAWLINFRYRVCKMERDKNKIYVFQILFFTALFDVVCYCNNRYYNVVFYVILIYGAVLVVILWLLDIQLPVQSLPLKTKVVSSNLVHGEVYSIEHYVITFISDFGDMLLVFSGFLHQ